MQRPGEAIPDDFGGRQDVTNHASIPTIGRVVNLVIPGGGLILIGCETLGLLVAILFTASTCYVITAWLLFPDDTTGAWRNLILGIALGTYVGSQIRYAQTVRHQRHLISESLRRAALRDCQTALRDGRFEAAWSAIEPVAELAETDLAVAYRLAQVHAARGDRVEARRAWEWLRILDRHGVYRVETVAAERALGDICEPDRVDC